MQLDNIDNRKFECEVNSFNYGDVERAISYFYDLGGANSSDFTELKENAMATISISFTKGDGKFNVFAYTKENGQKMIRGFVVGRIIRKKQ